MDLALVWGAFALEGPFPLTWLLRENVSYVRGKKFKCVSH